MAPIFGVKAALNESGGLGERNYGWKWCRNQSNDSRKPQGLQRGTKLEMEHKAERGLSVVLRLAEHVRVYIVCFEAHRELRNKAVVDASSC